MEQIVKSFAEFHEIVGNADARKKIFRGVSDAQNHTLRPSLGRLSLKQRSQSGMFSYERRSLSLFKKMALPYLERIPKNDLEWLVLAQHHGLPPRLLDWSYNPLVALFFAVKDYHASSVDKAVYVYKARDKTLTFSDEVNPFSLNRVEKLSPDYANERISAQRGLFTIHPDPRIPLEDVDRISKIVIKQDCAEDIFLTLRRYDITHARLFPGLDGVALLARGY